MSQTLIISAGGTGGGIYPALAVVTAIRNLAPQVKLQFVGSATGLEHELIQATHTHFDAYATVQAGPLHGVNPLKALESLLRLAIGTLQAILLMFRQRPQAIFLTGGWVGVPVAVAGYLFRVPIVIFVPDIEPGLTLKVLGRFAKIITATTADTQSFFPNKKVIPTGYPLRPEMLTATRAEGQKRFGLAADKPTLLVFGGSRGARSINRAMLQLAPALFQAASLQVIHVTGSLDWAECQTSHSQLPSVIQADYHLYEYLHDMGLAMAAADVVVSRAGASTLGEFPFFYLPSILIPYPHAWRYQRVNAEWLVSRGAAQMVLDENLNPDLLPAILSLVTDETARQGMEQPLKTLRIAEGAENIARVIVEQLK